MRQIQQASLYLCRLRDLAAFHCVLAALLLQRIQMLRHQSSSSSSGASSSDGDTRGRNGSGGRLKLNVRLRKLSLRLLLLLLKLPVPLVEYSDVSYPESLGDIGHKCVLPVTFLTQSAQNSRFLARPDLLSSKMWCCSEQSRQTV